MRFPCIPSVLSIERAFTGLRRAAASFFYGVWFLASWSHLAHAGLDVAGTRFREEIQPILEDRCFSCHGNGLKKGGLSLDAEEVGDTLIRDRAVWSSVLKNVRAGIMPPSGKPSPSDAEIRLLTDWIKRDVFGIDPENPDPGRVTLRRLNRSEYRNTIRDLMGIDFRTEEEFPPDDSGFGFDNVGDVLSISPLLLEKYLEAAETIVTKAVPTVSSVVRERSLEGKSFVGAEGKHTGDRLDFYREARVEQDVEIDREGDYRLVWDLEVAGEFDFDPGRCEVVFLVDGREQLVERLGWANRKRYSFARETRLAAGSHNLSLLLKPLTPVSKRVNKLDLRVVSVNLVGPLDERSWVPPRNYERFFFRGAPPISDEARRAYAREVIARFATRAYRRPVDEATVDRLMRLVGEMRVDQFEESVSKALVAVLASPRFVFRSEGVEPADAGLRYPRIDQFALASRLSYFLWGTMPDDRLHELAETGRLRSELPGQVERMLHDEKSQAFISNFVGQWLQVRDVEGIAINAAIVLARDKGDEKELERERLAFRARLNDPKAQPKRPPRFLAPRIELDGPLRRAMREESELCFSHVVRNDRSVLELLDSDYTFVNERLAKHYDLPDVKGPEMRKVSLPPGHFRGGVLTMGAVLVVTSNPTRTSPVKRGLFLLENILGTPAPPPPPDVPLLEEVEKAVEGHEPTMRESMVLHRQKPLCAACHARMDPLGLALENFNAMGMFRETERGQPIDPSGQLLSGELFKDVRDIKRILTHERRKDFYRCLTEKLLTYALGRGMNDLDTDTVDRIVDRLESEDGKFSALLQGVIESTPFQKTRRVSSEPPAQPKPDEPPR